MVNSYCLCSSFLCSLPCNGLFFTFSKFVGLSRCHYRIVVSTNHVRSDLHVSRRRHVTVLVGNLERTDWCKSRVMVHIKNNLQCFLLNQNAKGHCHVERLPTCTHSR